MFCNRSFYSMCKRKVHLKMRYQSNVKSPSSNGNSSKLTPISIARSPGLSLKILIVRWYAYVYRKWTAKRDAHTIHEHSKLTCCVSVSTTHRFYRCLVLVERTINRFSIVFGCRSHLVFFFSFSLNKESGFSLLIEFSKCCECTLELLQHFRG